MDKTEGERGRASITQWTWYPSSLSGGSLVKATGQPANPQSALPWDKGWEVSPPAMLGLGSLPAPVIGPQPADVGVIPFLPQLSPALGQEGQAVPSMWP